MIEARRHLLWILVWILAGVMAAGAAGQAAEKNEIQTVELGKRYVDPLHGFSLRPPAGTDRQRQRVAARLVSWTKRDPRTGAIAWTLSVLKVTETNEKIELKPYSQALAKKLQTQENFREVTTELAPVAGKAAIHLRGVSGGSLGLWQRQVWVLTKARKFLIIKITGPVDMKDRLDAICGAVLATLEVTDPKKALEKRKELLARGEKLLAGLTDKKLTDATHGEPQWCLLRFKGDDVGFMLTTESATRREGRRGYEVKLWVMSRLPKDQPRLLKRVLFTTVDRKLERWTESLQIGSGPTSVVIGEDGIRQDDVIVCNFARGDRIDTNKKAVPASLTFYLPRAIGLLLPRLVDLQEQTSYAFAVYAGDVNDFDMRTLKVIGPD
ncbi:MAG: hypothetical protein KAU28_08840, partial [Phycisphaerae bacterium]|nr:hypothetical protein [Phycisphaerae bacterium]